MLLKARLSGFYAETSQTLQGMMTFSEWVFAAAYSSLLYPALCPFTPSLLLQHPSSLNLMHFLEGGVGANKFDLKTTFKVFREHLMPPFILFIDFLDALASLDFTLVSH